MSGEESTGTTETTTTQPPATDTVDWKVEAEKAKSEALKWKEMSRKHEDRNKQLLPKAENWDKHEKASQTDHEKTVEEVRSAARTEALTEAGSRLVEAHIKAAARGKLSDEKVAKLIEFLDTKRFLGEDLTPDTARVEEFVNAQLPATTGTGSGPDMGQGRRASGTATGTAAGAAEWAAKKAQRTPGITAAN